MSRRPKTVDGTLRPTAEGSRLLFPDDLPPASAHVVDDLVPGPNPQALIKRGRKPNFTEADEQRIFRAVCHLIETDKMGVTAAQAKVARALRIDRESVRSVYKKLR